VVLENFVGDLNGKRYRFVSDHFVSASNGERDNIHPDPHL
jgi:hypothetical protein